MLLTENHLEFLSLKECCTGWSESTLVKMPHCWKSHVGAHIYRFNSISDNMFSYDTAQIINAKKALKLFAFWVIFDVFCCLLIFSKSIFSKNSFANIQSQCQTN